MTPNYTPCEYNQEAGRCGLPVSLRDWRACRTGGRVLCPRHRARLPLWPVDEADTAALKMGGS